MSKSSEYPQSELIKVMEKLGMKPDREGVCYGISSVLAYEFLSGDSGFKQFIRLINFIAADLKDTNRIDEKIDSARKTYREKINKILPAVKTIIIKKLQSDNVIPFNIEEEKIHTISSDDKNKILRDSGIDRLSRGTEELSVSLRKLISDNTISTASQIEQYISSCASSLAGQIVYADNTLLDEQTRILLEIHPLFESIHIMHESDKNHDIYGYSNTNHRQDASKTLSLLTPYFAEKNGGIAHVDNFVHSVKENTLSDFFRVLGENLTYIDEGVSMIVSGNKHAVSVCYKRDAGWYVCDPNKMPGKYIPLSNTEDLSTFLFEAWNTQDKNITLTIEMFSCSKNKEQIQNCLHTCESTHEWETARNTTWKNFNKNISDKMKLFNDHGLMSACIHNLENEPAGSKIRSDFLKMMIECGDGSRVVELMKQNPKIMISSPSVSDECSPLEYAALIAKENIIRYILESENRYNISSLTNLMKFTAQSESNFSPYESIKMLTGLGAGSTLNYNKQSIPDIISDENNNISDLVIALAHNNISVGFKLWKQAFRELIEKKDSEKIFLILDGYQDYIQRCSNEAFWPYPSLMHCAVSSGSADLVDVLIKCQIKADFNDKKKGTPLQYAASLEHEDICRLLRAAVQGQKPEVTEKSSSPPLSMFGIMGKTKKHSVSNIPLLPPSTPVNNIKK